MIIADFHLLSDDNDCYDQYIDKKALRLHKDSFAKEYGGSYDAAYALSVFTHIDVNDFEPLLRYVGSLLKAKGQFLFTAFLLTPFSRSVLAGPTKALYPNAAFEANKRVFVGNRADRLAFIAYDGIMLEEMILRAGLVPAAIEYGGWRQDGFSTSLQDIVVCRKAG